MFKDRRYVIAKVTFCRRPSVAPLLLRRDSSSMWSLPWIPSGMRAFQCDGCETKYPDVGAWRCKLLENRFFRPLFSMFITDIRVSTTNSRHQGSEWARNPLAIVSRREKRGNKNWYSVDGLSSVLALRVILVLPRSLLLGTLIPIRSREDRKSCRKNRSRFAKCAWRTGVHARSARNESRFPGGLFRS